MTGPTVRDRFLVDEMLRHLSVVESVAKAGRETLERDPTQRYALEHACELLAEAAKHTSQDLRTRNPDVAWGALRELRSAVAHPYDIGASPVRVDRLWRFAVEDCLRLRRQLRRVRIAR